MEVRRYPPGAPPDHDEGGFAGASLGTAAAAARAVALIRLVAYVWAAVGFLLAADDLERPVPATLLMAAAGVITAASLPHLVHPRQARWPGWLLLCELVVGWLLASGSGWAYEQSASGPTSLTTLGGIWPLAGVLAAGVSRGPWAGGAAGLAFGAARLAGAVATAGGWPPAAQWWSIASTTVLSVAAGTVVAATLRWIGRLEAQAAEAEAQERLARELHDGVLQTLAAIEARSRDPQAAGLARAESRRLRDHLFAPPDVAGLDRVLATRLARVEDAYGVRCELAFVEHVEVPADLAERIGGAVGEAAVNAAKHGGVGCTVLVLPEADGVAVSVHDEGPGFDPAALAAGAGEGLRRSIRGRIEEVGGTVEIDSRPGEGCEVRLWVPCELL
jgi:signal transduction histidine kinase